MRTTKQLLGARIKEIRRERGLSQEELSEQVGIDAKHLSRIEVGGSYPSLDTLEKIGKILNVELKDFFEFSHLLEDRKEMKDALNSLMKEATEERLKLAIKVLRAIVR